MNRLDLQTLGSEQIMPKNLPVHWLGGDLYVFRKSMRSSTIATFCGRNVSFLGPLMLYIVGW